VPAELSKQAVQALGRMLQLEPGKRASAKEIIGILKPIASTYTPPKGDLDVQMRLDAYERHLAHRGAGLI
jgi:hypothetical protein